ncbi:extracellular solute-binding protein [Streptomyces pseudovenezuelae]|uniref:N,N'-diacetylchitobiose transport system substrate-binding protein n=1 Tax=Streptomyces pseudovenezuelae TaxID=67350 RepID=A0ABT6LZW9_9ACTN|nr:extracellular solute-binding protein [Streptomyces pseudovenezuelae]MDH6221216.1 N,N'-diacetylchitobiose transport system substrate-binding protein [Streptomyces pseudovenezuelae]
MKLSPRLAVVLTALVVTACAPQTSSNSSSEKDDKSGTLRVWLFQEVGNKPKEKVVDSVVDAFQKAHKGTKVDVEYIPIETRAQRVKAAFNDPKSAPDVMEYGNTDTAGYVHDGGLLDVTKEFGAWSEAKDSDPTAKQSVTVDGKLYGSPFYVGVRALYYRTDVFQDLGLQPPKTMAELATTARKIRAEKPDLYGLVVGGAYTYGAMPFVWANGGELATGEGDSYTSAIDGAAAQKGIKAYTSLFTADNCPAAKCAGMGGNDTITAFAAGKAGMAIGGDFSHTAVEAGKVKGKYAVVPLPGVASGSIAPAFAGGNNIGVLKSTSHRSLAVDLMEQLTSKKTQSAMFDAMGFLPTFTDVRDAAAAKVPFEKPFVQTLGAGTKFVPASPAWSQIDSQLVLPNLLQEVISGKKGVAAAAKDAAQKMNDSFASAG